MATEALELEESGLSYQRVPPTNRWLADVAEVPRGGGKQTRHRLQLQSAGDFPARSVL